MGNIERLDPRTSLEQILTHHGITVPDQPTFHVPSVAAKLELNMICGYETSLPDGSTGRFIVRAVSDAPDTYIKGLPEDHEHSVKFHQNRLSGILADAQVLHAQVLRVTSRKRLYVARRSILILKNPDNTTRLNFTSFNEFGIGRTSDTDTFVSLNHFTWNDNARELGLSEMEYSEPSKLRMIWSALTS